MNKGIDTILVTGATGRQGGALARELLDAGHQVTAMTRRPDSEPARALAARGAAVIRGDLDDDAALRRALHGVFAVFGLQNTWETGVEREEEQGKRLAILAREAGVRHYVYSSVASADRRTGIPHFDNKARVEDTVRRLAFPSWTIVRPVFFMENLLSPWFKPQIDQGTLAMGIKPATRLQMIAVADVGRYLFLAMDQHESLNGRELDIAGDELTMPAVAHILTKVTGRPITHFQVPIEEVRKASEDWAIMLEWFDAVGYDADIAANEQEFGIRPTQFGEWAARQTW